MNMKNLTDSLKQEFVCYYHEDLIPENWKNKDVINELANESVSRLDVVVDKKSDLLELFKTLSGNRLHPINKILSDETGIEWCIEDDDWCAYRALLIKMIELLEK